MLWPASGIPCLTSNGATLILNSCWILTISSELAHQSMHGVGFKFQVQFQIWLIKFSIIYQNSKWLENYKNFYWNTFKLSFICQKMSAKTSNTIKTNLNEAKQKPWSWLYLGRTAHSFFDQSLNLISCIFWIFSTIHHVSAMFRTYCFTQSFVWCVMEPFENKNEESSRALMQVRVCLGWAGPPDQAYKSFDTFAGLQM